MGGIRTKIALLALLCASLPAVLVSFIAFSSTRVHELTEPAGF